MNRVAASLKSLGFSPVISQYFLNLLFLHDAVCRNSKCVWARTGGDRGILSILQVLTSGRTGFGCLETKPPANRRGCVNSTPTNTARTELHTAQSNFITRGSRAARLKDCTSSLCP